MIHGGTMADPVATVDVGTMLITGLAQGGPVSILAALGLYLWSRDKKKNGDSSSAPPGEAPAPPSVPLRANGTPLTWADVDAEKAIKVLPELIREGNETGRKQLKQTQEMTVCLKALQEFDSQLLAAATAGNLDHQKAQESLDEALYLLQQSQGGKP